MLDVNPNSDAPQILADKAGNKLILEPYSDEDNLTTARFSIWKGNKYIIGYVKDGCVGVNPVTMEDLIGNWWYVVPQDDQDSHLRLSENGYRTLTSLLATEFGIVERIA